MVWSDSPDLVRGTVDLSQSHRAWGWKIGPDLPLGASVDGRVEDSPPSSSSEPPTSVRSTSIGCKAGERERTVIGIDGDDADEDSDDDEDVSGTTDAISTRFSTAGTLLE